MTVPDGIAYSRILLVPVIMAFILYHESMENAFGIAFILFLGAAVTDFLDGYLARRWDQTSVLGAFLDSGADKILVLGTLAALVEVGRAWAWALFVIIGRELAVMGLRGVAAMEQSGVPPSVWGKIKATVQFLAIGLAMIRLSEPWGPLFLDEWVMLVAIGVTILSGWGYFSRFGRVFRTVQERVR